jgi:hypothetical protein
MSSPWVIQVFWVLWWHNLLLSSLFLRIFFAIIRRKIFPYPTVQELHQRRKEIGRSNAFGRTVQAHLTPSSPFGLQELWRIFKIFNKPKVDKAKNIINDKVKVQEGIQSDNNLEGERINGSVDQTPGEAVTVLDGSDDAAKQDGDAKRAILQMLSDIADLHERIKK